MLYNKNWDKPVVKADPLSLDDLISWLEKQPAKQFYPYQYSNLCLMAQWAAQFGAQKARDQRTHAYETQDRYIDLAPFHMIACKLPHTFGGALKRAKRMRGDRWWKFW